MAAKINVALRAATARFNRVLKKEGKKLLTLPRPIDGYGRYGIVDLNSNSVIAYGDANTLKSWMAESGVIKQYENIEF